MADLYDRTSPLAGSDRIPVHQFAAALHFIADGGFSQAQVVTRFSLDAAATANLTSLASTYASKPTAVAKLAYLLKVERVLMLVEDGTITTKAQAVALLGI